MVAKPRKTGRAVASERADYTLRFLKAACDGMQGAHEALVDAVLSARLAGNSWRVIGKTMGVTGEAVRKAYGDRVDAVLSANQLRLVADDELEDPTAVE